MTSGAIGAPFEPTIGNYIIYIYAVSGRHKKVEASRMTQVP